MRTTVLVLSVVLLIVSACSSPQPVPSVPAPSPTTSLATPTATVNFIAEGDARLKHTQYVEALSSYQQAIDAGIDIAQAEARRGFVLALQYDFSAALLAAQHAVQLAPHDPDVLAYLALVHTLAGDDKAAIDTAQQAVTTQPNNGWSQIALAKANLTRGTLQTALTAAEAAVQIDPEQARAHNILGRVLWQMNQLDKAEQSLARATKLDPEFALWKLDLALLKIAKGQRDLARQLVTEAIAVGPQECRSFAVRAGINALDGTSVYTDVVQAYQANPLCRPADTFVRSIPAREFTPDLQDLLLAAAASHPDDLQAQTILAQVYDLTCQADQVTVLFDRLRQQSPEDARVPVLIAEHFLNPTLSWSSFSWSPPRTMISVTALISHTVQALTHWPNDAALLNYLGRAYYVQGDYDQAVATFKHELEVTPDEPETLRNLASAYGSRNPELAVTTLEQAKELAPWNISIKQMLCQAYQAVGRIEDALQECQSVIDLRPDLTAGYTGLARIFLRTGRAEKIKDLFEQALSHAPDRAIALIGLADFYRREGKNVQRAVETLRKAVESDPDSERLKWSLAQALHLHTEDEEASRVYQSLSSQYPITQTNLLLELVPVYRALDQNTEANQALQMLQSRQSTLGQTCESQLTSWQTNSLAALLAESDIYTDAVTLYVQTTDDQLWPNNNVDQAARLLLTQQRNDEAVALYQHRLQTNESADLLVRYAKTLHQIKRDTEAIAAYRRAIQREPGQTSAYLALAGLYLDQSDAAQAAAILSEMIAVTPADPERTFIAGVLLFDRKQYDLAKKFIEQAIQQWPDNARYAGKLADVFYYSGQSAQALPLYQQAEKLNPQSAWYPAQLADCYKSAGDLNKAYEAIVRALAIDPSTTSVLRFLADKYVKADDISAAEDVFRKAAQRQPDNPWLLTAWGLFYKDHGQWATAIAKLQQAADMNPDYFEHYFDVGLAQFNSEDYSGATQAFKRATDDQPANDNRWAWLGAGQLQNGKPAEAVTALETAIKLNGKAGWYYARLGNAYLLVGKLERARDVLKRALELDPNDKFARSLLNSIH